MKTNKRIVAVILCVVMLFAGLSGCKKKGDFDGNMSNITDQRAGDVYAVITVKGFSGEMYFKLFEDIAPVGVAEFIRVAENGYYDGKSFHRVLSGMLIQGGALNMDGSDPVAPVEDMFEVETHKNARHFNGALCFAVDEKTGLNYRQFYIVTANKPVNIESEAGKLKTVLDELDQATATLIPSAQRKEYDELHNRLSKMPDAVKERYSEKGGIPLLDGQVTVFGQLITGHELLEEIGSVPVVRGNKIDDENPVLGKGNGQASRPADDIFIETIKIIQIPKEETTTRKK